MYDRTWARSVYGGYTKLCTRAQQIDACIQSVIKNRWGFDLPRFNISYALISSIQGKQLKRLWPLYKRLNKKTPLDKDLLETVSNLVFEASREEVVQFSFEFEVDVEKKLRQLQRG